MYYDFKEVLGHWLVRPPWRERGAVSPVKHRDTATSPDMQNDVPARAGSWSNVLSWAGMQNDILQWARSREPACRMVSLAKQGDEAMSSVEQDRKTVMSLPESMWTGHKSARLQPARLFPSSSGLDITCEAVPCTCDTALLASCKDTVAALAWSQLELLPSQPLAQARLEWPPLWPLVWTRL